MVSRREFVHLATTSYWLWGDLVRLALLAAAGVLAVAGAAWAGAPSDQTTDEALVKDPDWLAAPSFEERAKAYPEAALDAAIGGETMLRCTVQPDGGLAGCVLASETPTGMGFGQAALALADQFRMKPQAVPLPAPGQAAPAVRVPIRWAIVDRPKWAHVPNTDQMADLYPRDAASHGVQGEAKVRCEVKADGTLTNCFTLFEAPEGMGFGMATQVLARYFRMEPAKLDGQPIDGAMVTLPVRWSFGVPGEIGGQFQVGEGAKLVVVLKPGAKPPTDMAAEQVFDCPSSTDPARKCLAISATWKDQPSNAQTWAVMNQRHIKDGVTSLGCRVGDDGALGDCNVLGKATPDQEAAMRELAAGLKAALKTWYGGVPTRGRVVRVGFDWAQLRLAAKPAAGARR